MKNLFVALTITVLSLSCQNNQVQMKSDLETNHLQGKVWKVEKKINDSEARCLCPAAQSDDCKQSLTIYNKEGNIAKLLEINPDGDTANCSVYKYNRRGVCTGIDKYSKKILSESEIPEIKDGKLIKLKILDEKVETKAICEYEYADNNLIKITELDENGALSAKTENEYAQGNLIAQKITNKEGKIKSSVRFKRNDRNDVIESVFEIPGDTTMHKITFAYDYDDAGNWVKQTKYYRDEIASVVTRNIKYY